MIGWAVAKGAWALISGNPITRALIKIGGLILAVLTFGAWHRRQGAQGQKAKADLRNAKETIKAHEVRNEVENRIARERDARDKLRSDWSE